MSQRGSHEMFLEADLKAFQVVLEGPRVSKELSCVLRYPGVAEKYQGSF